MTIRLFSGYSTDYIIPTTAAIAIPVGTYKNVPGPTGKFFTGFSASIDFWNYKDFLAELGTSLSNGYGGGYSFTFSYDWPSNRVRMLANSGSTPYGFNFIWDQNLQQILGFPAQHISQSQITGSNPPWYVWTATNPNVTADTEIYENASIYNEGVADSGRTYSTGKTKTVQYQDWVWGMEAQSNLFQGKALFSNSYTYDIFIEQIRKGPYHFIKFDDIDQTITTMSYAQRDGTYELREDAYVFKPQKIFGDNDDYVFYWNVPIKTRMLSRPNQNLSDQFGNLPITTSATPPSNGLSLWLKASAGGTYVSQSSGQGICYSQINDYSGMNNNTQTNANSYLQLVTRSTLGGACYGLFSSSTPFSSISTNNQIGDASASFFNSTASGITVAFPCFVPYDLGFLDQLFLFSASFPNTNTIMNIYVQSYTNYYGDFQSPIVMLFADPANAVGNVALSTYFSGSKDHFFILSYDNNSFSGNIWRDGSTSWSINGTSSTSASIGRNGAYTIVSCSNHFSYSFMGYSTTFGTKLSASFMPEILVYNYAISSSAQINQINQYFGSRYPTVSYSLV